MSLVRYNVLIAHIDRDVRENIVDSLNEQFHNLNFYYADDGPQVARMIEQMRVNFLFLEMEIPKKSGEGVLLEIKALKISERPSLIYLLSDTDFSRLSHKGKQTQISYLRDLNNLNLAKAQISSFFMPKEDKVNEGGSTNGDGPAESKQLLDVELMNPIVNATLNVFDVMIDLQPKKEAVKMEKANVFIGDISAYYPIKSSKFEGFFCISFPKNAYLETMSLMLFEDYTEINDENRDGIGEICNQVVGNAKAHFNEVMESEISMATPVIETKASSPMMNSLKGNKIIIEFSCATGTFFVEVAMSKISEI